MSEDDYALLQQKQIVLAHSYPFLSTRLLAPRQHHLIAAPEPQSETRPLNDRERPWSLLDSAAYSVTTLFEVKPFSAEKHISSVIEVRRVSPPAILSVWQEANRDSLCEEDL